MCADAVSSNSQNMVPMLTVAEEVDCGASDSLEFDVPLVNPNAAIYFVNAAISLLPGRPSILILVPLPSSNSR